MFDKSKNSLGLSACIDEINKNSDLFAELPEGFFKIIDGFFKRFDLFGKVACVTSDLYSTGAGEAGLSIRCEPTEALLCLAAAFRARDVDKIVIQIKHIEGLL